MRAMIKPVGLMLLILGWLVACGPSEEELNATATAIAADVFATQTAEAPTPTYTPTPTLTPTNTPTNTPTTPPASTPTVRPSPTPTLTPAPTPEYSQMGLTLEDLPAGYAVEPGMEEVFPPGEDGPFSVRSTYVNSFGFSTPEEENFIVGFSATLAGGDSQAFDSQIDYLNQLFLAGFSDPTNTTPPVELADIDDIGDASSGLTATVTNEGEVYLMEVLTFRRGTVAVFLSGGHLEGSELTVSSADLARIVDGRILRATGLVLREATD